MNQAVKNRNYCAEIVGDGGDSEFIIDSVEKLEFWVGITFL